MGGVEGLLGPGSSISCTFVEVRDEQVHDLLGKGRNLRVRETMARGVHVPSATVRPIAYEEDVMRALVVGLHNRGATTWRGEHAPFDPKQRQPGGGRDYCGHVIFTLSVRARTAGGGIDGSPALMESRLQLVDLGSAGTPKPGSRLPKRNEASKSLVALSRCNPPCPRILSQDHGPVHGCLQCHALLESVS